MSRSVLIITERYFPERFLINDLISGLVADNIKVRVLTQVPSYPEDRLYPGYANIPSSRVEGLVNVTRFKTVLGYRRSLARKLLNYLSFMIKASSLALSESRSVDAVFVYHTGPLTQALPLVLVKLFKRLRTVIWTQDVWPDTVFAYGFPSTGAFAVLLKAFVRFIYRFTDEVLVSSPGFVDRLKPYLSEEKVARFVPQWVPDAFLDGGATSLDLSGFGTRFIFTGNIGTMQNLENVIRAFDKVGVDKATFLILGNGTYKNRLEGICLEEKIKNVRFLGSVEQAQVKACIEACDFSVISLISDRQISLTIPAKFQTYLAVGRPILAVASGEIYSLVDKENLGVCADPDDISAIAMAIERATGSTDNERALWSKNMSRLLGYYNKSSIIFEIERALF